MRSGRCSNIIIVPAVLICLAAAGCSAAGTPGEPRLPASVNADCAPWDGAAFSIAIPLDTGRLVRISIYQSPHIPHPTRFSFPDPTGRVGQVLLQRGSAANDPLSGRVSLQSVEVGTPIEGDFDLVSESGIQYRGRFLAIWGEVRAYCG